MCYCMSAYVRTDVQIFCYAYPCWDGEFSIWGQMTSSIALFHILWPRARVSLNVELTNGRSGCQQALSNLQPLSMSPLLSSPGWHCGRVCVRPCRPFLKSGRDPTQVFMLIQQALYPLLHVSKLLDYLICKIASCVQFFLWNIDWLVQLS